MNIPRLYTVLPGVCETHAGLPVVASRKTTGIGVELSLNDIGGVCLNKSDQGNAVTKLARGAFQKYAPALHRFLLRRIRRPQEIDDMAQEVFARLMRVENAEFVRKPASYLFGIATNVVREFRIRAEHDQERVTFDSEMVDHVAEHPSEMQWDELPERLDLQRQLERGLAQLPPMHRTVLLLVTRDGLTHEEAAKTAHLSIHTVEKYVTEARARLKLLPWDR